VTRNAPPSCASFWAEGGYSEDRPEKSQKKLTVWRKCPSNRSRRVFYVALQVSAVCARAPRPILDAGRTRDRSRLARRRASHHSARGCRSARLRDRSGCLPWFGCAHARGARNYASVAENGKNPRWAPDLAEKGLGSINVWFSALTGRYFGARRMGRNAR
jgi:hypothetical protein